MQSTNRKKSVDTIAAIATPVGQGGVGIVRVSGDRVKHIAEQVLGQVPRARYATHQSFKGFDESVIDEGIALFFPNPHSFTGEDVLELQGHGGPVVLDQVLQSVLRHGARLANPGEFSERAFLNDKIDLTQAEAIADLISAQSVDAARSAMHSLQGDFSKRIHELLELLIRLRVFVEAAIDFPEEEIDFIAESDVRERLHGLITQLEMIEQTAKQGALLQEGMRLVLLGSPNTGKSSLLNALSGKDSAIVTEIPGTTRDVLREAINIDGLPVQLIDTAGLRETTDVVEQEGMRRARRELEKADAVLFVMDATQPELSLPEYLKGPVIILKNKIDLIGLKAAEEKKGEHAVIQLSVKTGEGMDLLKARLKENMGYQKTQEGTFSARRRHLDALTRAKTALTQGLRQLADHQAAELLAEDLRQAQEALSEITGDFTPDHLLGEIFSSFCIGK